MWSRTKKKPWERSSRTVTWQSADFQTTFFRRSNQVEGDATVGRLSNNCFPRYQAIGRIFEKKSLNGHATVGRLQINVFWTFRTIWNYFQKNHWTVTWQWSEVRRLSGDCQTKFLDVSSNFENFWKKSLNGHATVVGCHATVGRLSIDVFGRFKQFGNFLKKVPERSRDNGRRSRDRRLTVEQRFSTFQAIWRIFEKSHWTVTRLWSEVTRLSADCQAHTCMYIIITERERKRDREYLRYASCRHRHVVPLAVLSAGVDASPLKLALAGV